MKSVVISGAASGIGAATAQRFLSEGYFVFALDVQAPQYDSDQLTFIECDVSSVADIDNAIEVILENTETVDALVCSAGVHFSATVLDSSEEDYERLMAINVKGSFFLTKAILPLMLKKMQGAIVYVGSDQNFIAKKNSVLYGMTKAALGSLAKSTALDFAKEGVRANLVAAGTIETALYHQAIEKYCRRTGADVNEVHRMEALEQPLERIGQPEEVANLIYFLCSDQAQFITGAVIPIDGGYTAQ